MKVTEQLVIEHFKGVDYKEAISCFDEAIHLDSAEADVYYWRGRSKYFLQQHVEAIDDFDKAIELKDDDINYYRLRGYAQQVLNRFGKAKDDLEMALRLAQQSEGTILIDGIRFKLREINLQITEGDQWTPERF